MDKLAIKIPRYCCYTSEIYFRLSDKPMANILYRFCDASTAEYAAVVYLCVGPDPAYFVASKTQVSPLSHQTISCLELLSCLLLAMIIFTIFVALETVNSVKVVSRTQK